MIEWLVRSRPGSWPSLAAILQPGRHHSSVRLFLECLVMQVGSQERGCCQQSVSTPPGGSWPNTSPEPEADEVHRALEDQPFLPRCMRASRISTHNCLLLCCWLSCKGAKDQTVEVIEDSSPVELSTAIRKLSVQPADGPRTLNQLTNQRLPQWLSPANAAKPRLLTASQV